MVGEKDVWRVAKYVMEEHGNDAVNVAAQCADAFTVCGKVESQHAWERIIRAIGEWQRTAPREDERVN
jgi:hypothetical protein